MKRGLSGGLTNLWNKLDAERPKNKKSPVLRGYPGLLSSWTGWPSLWKLSKSLGEKISLNPWLDRKSTMPAVSGIAGQAHRLSRACLSHADCGAGHIWYWLKWGYHQTQKPYAKSEGQDIYAAGSFSWGRLGLNTPSNESDLKWGKCLILPCKQVWVHCLESWYRDFRKELDSSI